MCVRDGDVVEVMERCDDGWYVGLNQRTGQFGTFPGNYVEQIWSAALNTAAPVSYTHLTLPTILRV